MTDWISCSKRMPPDDSTEVIAQYRDYPPVRVNADRVCGNGQIDHLIANYKEDTKWIYYSDDAWREVNQWV